MEAATHSYQLSTWRGEFVDPATEQAFRKHVEPTMARHLRVAVLIWAALLLLFGLLDYQGLGWSEGFAHLMLARAGAAMFLCGFAWRLRRHPELASSGYGVSALAVIGFLMFFIIYFARPDITIWNIGVTLILLISLFLFIPGRVYPSLLAALFGIAGTLYCIALKGSTAATLVGLSFILLLPVIVGFAAALRLQLVQRQQFSLYSQVIAANRELEAEIERRKALEEELKRQATTDPLTGLFNRRQYEMLFHREWERCNRLREHLSLCVVDLDHFKQINDSYGHDLGDKVLVHVANLFTRTLRQSDVIGRFGGEEFILLLPDTDITQARHVVGRLREQLEVTPVPVQEADIKLTATFAVTEVRKDDQGINDVIRRADQALYEGKKAGRNQVVEV